MEIHFELALYKTLMSEKTEPVRVQIEGWVSTFVVIYAISTYWEVQLSFVKSAQVKELAH